MSIMKNKLKKIVVGTLSGTILLESCTNGYYLNYDVEDINEVISKTSDSFNSTALPINVQFEEGQLKYLLFIQNLAQDIISDSNVAKLFIEDPDKYLSDKGFDKENFNIDSKLTQIILGLADEEICNAITSGNIARYISLLKNKGLIDNISINELNSLKDYSININNALGLNGNQQELASAFAFAAAVLVGAIAVVWVVVVEHFGAANAVGALTAIAWKVGAITSGNKITNISDNIMSTRAFQIWNLKSQDPDTTYLVADELTANTVDSLIEYFKTHMPDLYNNTDLQILRNAIIANIQKFSYE